MNDNESSTDAQTHWEQVYRTKDAAQQSWFQDEPAISLELIRTLMKPGDRVIDVGGGSSILASTLLASGAGEVTVLDLSAAAIERAKVRNGQASQRIRWIVGDITRQSSLPPVDIWHDRAVFHFLTQPDQRARYADTLCSALRPGGHAVLATFHLDGPEECSGLPVVRYDAAAIARELGDEFAMVDERREEHVTPWGRTQSFVYAVLQRNDTICRADD